LGLACYAVQACLFKFGWPEDEKFLPPPAADKISPQVGHSTKNNSKFTTNTPLVACQHSLATTATGQHLHKREFTLHTTFDAPKKYFPLTLSPLCPPAPYLPTFLQKKNNHTPWRNDGPPWW